MERLPPPLRVHQGVRVLVVPKALQTTLLNQMEALSRPRWFRVWVIDMNSAMKIVQGEGSRTDLLLLIFPNVWDIIGASLPEKHRVRT